MNYRLLTINLLLLTGCYYQPKLPSDIPPLTNCKITVTQDGVPLAGAVVSLESIDGGEKWRVGSTTDADGTAVPFTNGLFSGVPQGKYKIIVSKIESDTDTRPQEPEAGDTGYDEWQKKYANVPPPSSYSVVEKRYTTTSTTPHKIEVSGKKTIEIKIDIGKKIREKINP
ncbi:MAG: carboxypeptidase-like regulatory domain-containing protein [Planctomycetaceae bacterium]|jgi:hypothetical protein|nr:carboxypeptidase-like regulatory domain-containing protein [Planctomycetaceae bacterium]